MGVTELVRKGRESNKYARITENPVSDLWDIRLLYGKHQRFSKPTYAVYFQTKLFGEDHCTILHIDLLENEKKALRELNVFGHMSESSFIQVLDYIIFLKVSGNFEQVDDLTAYSEDRASVAESFELFERVRDSILDDLDAFPLLSSEEYNPQSCSGVLLDTEQYVSRYGEGAVGVSPEFLVDLLDLSHTRVVEVARRWREQGWLLKSNRETRLQEAIKLSISTNIKRFYVLKIGVSTKRIAE